MSSYGQYQLTLVRSCRRISIAKRIVHTRVNHLYDISEYCTRPENAASKIGVSHQNDRGPLRQQKLSPLTQGYSTARKLEKLTQVTKRCLLTRQHSAVKDIPTRLSIPALLLRASPSCFISRTRDFVGPWTRLGPFHSRRLVKPQPPLHTPLAIDNACGAQ